MDPDGTAYDRQVTIIDKDGNEMVVTDDPNAGHHYLEKVQNQQRFLAAFQETGVVTYACKKAKVTRQNVKHWLSKDQDFSAQYAEALSISTEVMEAEAIRRATKGTVRPAIQSGRLVGHVREYSDVLLIFLLKSRKPEVYRDQFDIRVRGTQDWVPLTELLAELPPGE